MKKRFLWLTVGLISLGMTACGGGGPTDTSNYHPSIVFAETWENYPVGSFPSGGWIDGLQPMADKVIQFPQDHKMYLRGPIAPSSSGYGGIGYQFKPGTMLPTYIRYNIHPYPMDLDPGNESPPFTHIGNLHILGNQGTLNTLVGIDVGFLHDGDGNGILNSGGVCFPECSPNSKVPIDNSFLVELKNIHWDTYPHITYDYWVNGSEVESCLPISQPIESITYLMFFNQEYGAFHFDNIFMANLPYDNTCIELGEPPLPDMMPLPPEPPPSDPILFIFEMPAFCRSGPSTEYPKISTYPEGGELEISGQNIEGSWWWSEEGGCWVSHTVGELIGDVTTLEIIIPLPPPAEEDTVDKDKGKTSSCKTNLSKEACLKAGGTWDDQPGQPGKCVCP